MQNPEPGQPGRRGLALALLACLLFASGCQLAGTRGLVPIETREETGFTITESARLGVGDRGRFDDALEAIEAGELERGIAILEALAEESPEVATLHIDLGIAYQRAEEFEAAADALERALALHATHPVALNELGIVMRRQGRFDEARLHYEAILDRHPDFHHARKNLAILCDLYLRDLECALRHYERYAEAVPGDDQAPIWIADLRNRQAEGRQ